MGICTGHFDADMQQLNPILDFTEASLARLHISDKTARMARFQAEDVLKSLIRSAAEGARIEVRVSHFLGRAQIRLSCPGTPAALQPELAELFTDQVDGDTQALIRSRLLRWYESRVDMAFRNGRNIATVTAARGGMKPLTRSLAAMAAGILLGLLIRALCPAATAQWLAESVFGTGASLFLRAIKMTIGFTVFFSIVAGISGYRDLRELGSVFGRVMGLFAATSIVTIAVAYGVYCLNPIGDPALRAAVGSAEGLTVMESSGSPGDMLLNIVPDNLLHAFLHTDMLQILFLAAVTCAAIMKMSKHRSAAQRAVDTLDELFTRITGLVSQFIPVCIFCSMASMVIRLRLGAFASLSGWVVMIYACDILVLGLLLIFVAAGGHTSPGEFLRNFGSVMVSAFAMASSNAVMPLTLEACRDKLKISPRIYTFSVPLGIVVNMDGGCVTLLITTLFLGRVYGIQFTGEALLRIFFSVFMLSVAAPGVNGGTLLCLTALIPQAGIPIEAVTLIVGLYFLISTIQTVVNVTSTVVVTFVVDRQLRHSRQA